jgi:hypothetical protein
MNDFNITILHNGTEASYYNRYVVDLSLYELIKEYDAIRSMFSDLNSYVARGYELWDYNMMNEDQHPALECEVDRYKDIITAFKQVHGITIKETFNDSADKLQEFWGNYHCPF